MLRTEYLEKAEKHKLKIKKLSLILPSTGLSITVSESKKRMSSMSEQKKVGEV